MASRRVQAVVMAAALAVGYTGAAAIDAWGVPPLEVADDFGPGDGLTRYVVTAAGGDVTHELLAVLEATADVVSAQPLHDGTALVATDGLGPHQLEAVPGVADAEFSTSVPVLGTITDPYFPQYGWNLENTGSNFYNQSGIADADVDASLGWDGGTGAGLVVAITDTGFDTDHPDLAGALWTNPAESCGGVDTDGNGLAGDCHGWNFYSNNADLDNAGMDSHGTSVAGVVGARANNGVGTAGVAPDVSIMPLVIGGGSTVDVNLGAQAIRYAVDHGAHVINASWGGQFTGSALQALRDAVAYAAAHDVLVVVAAGNDSGNRDTSIFYPASLTDPNVITVGNSNAADEMSASSAYGATNVDLFAPGNLVATTWNDGGTMLVSGTSIAAPQVAAAVALYRAQLPAAGYAEIKQAVFDDVDLLPAFAGKSVTGGRLTVGALAEAPVDVVSYTFGSMTAPAGVVTPTVQAAGEDVRAEYSATIGLGMEYAGEIWALADKAVTVGGTTLTTDDAGEAVFPLGTADSPSALDLSPSLELADGRYVLTVQLHRDGNALGRTYAAPLLVGTAAEEEPGGEQPGDEQPGDEQPGDDAPAGPGDGGNGPGTEPGSGGDEPGDGGSPAPGTPGDGGGDGSDGAGGDSTPESPAEDAPNAPVDPGGAVVPAPPGTDTPGDGPGGSDEPAGPGAPGAPDAPGTGNGPGNDGSEGGSDDPSDEPGGSTDPGDEAAGPAPDDGGSVTYPGVGPFSITGMSPVRVATAGGTLVTITGDALPIDPQVRIGATAAADVVTSTATRLVFRTPARVAGVYDVHVFARDGRSDVLEAALTYTDDPVSPGDGGDGGDGSDGSGSAPPVVREGPNGERLVRTTKFAGLLPTIFDLDCATTCSGRGI